MAGRIDALDRRRARSSALVEGGLPEGWERPLLAYKKRKGQASRSGPTSRRRRDLARPVDAYRSCRGAPDLEAATQHKRDMQPFTATNPAGRYIHYGVTSTHGAMR